MTDGEINDCYSSIGRAFAERRDLEKKIHILEARLRAFSKAFEILIENPVHEESQKALEATPAPIEDLETIHKDRQRHRELNRILSS